MHYTKPALTIEDQVKLIQGRGLAISDPARAVRWLNRVGYYRLSAYLLPFKTPGSDQFAPGATFDEVTDLYKFDAGLRLLVFQATDRVEVALRASITYHMAHALGPFGYVDPTNFAPTFQHAEFMRILDHEQRRSAETFVTHYRAKYTSERHLPIWMATELISFGALSKMYENLRARLRKQVAREYGISQPVFVSWLHTLSYVRNTCAHHSRLWNRELAVKPELPHVWTAEGVTNDRIYCVLLILQTLLSVVAPESKWKERLKAHIAAYPAISSASMKFPPDWTQQKIWE